MIELDECQREFLHHCSGIEVFAVVEEEGQLFCQRCYNDNQQQFAKCEDGFYCRDCLAFGRVSTTTKLVRTQKRRAVSEHAHQMNLQYALSSLQKEASTSAIHAFNQRQNHYIWAVCGAGKTEMMYGVIAKALQEGHRICWTIPRRDVVIELKPRLQSVFTYAKVIAMYGGSDENQNYGDIVLATTHQLIHFYEAFELIIIDEVDAFPYTHDVMLPRLLQKAKRKTGVIHYLSATPSPEDKLKIKRGEIASCVVPVRYHQKRLDVPNFVSCYEYESKILQHLIPRKIKAYLTNQQRNKRRTLLFVPTIQIGQILSSILNIPFVHSQDEQRSHKIAHYKQSGDLFLLTTMILERGITIVNIDIAIIGAEHDVFEESALVQISGRVGRHPDYYQGNITFFHDGLSKSMIRAQTHIRAMNYEAKKRGLL